jgi:tripartite-type tricarboxylate transporter receptor subunit TctC
VSRGRVVVCFAAVLLAATPLAHAQEDYPSKPVKMIVPYPAGGTADTLPRILGERLREKWGQPIVVENRSGAGGNIGAEAVARAEADGYTLLASPPAPIAVNQSLYKKLAFDPATLVPVTVMAAVPNVLVVHPSVTAKSVQELIAFAKANPRKLNYASQGSGTTSHLTANLFQSMANVELVHVPYKGTAPALTDLLGGQVDLMFDNLGSSLAHIRTGKLRALGVGSVKRVASLPDVPTIAESGLPKFQSVTWFAIMAPPKTPAAIVTRISTAVSDVLKHPDVIKRFEELSAEPVGGTPAETAAFIQEEVVRWREVIRTAGVTVE